MRLAGGSYDYFFSRIRVQRIIVLRRRRNWYSVRLQPKWNGLRWTQTAKLAEHNPKDKLPHELLTSHTT